MFRGGCMGCSQSVATGKQDAVSLSAGDEPQLSVSEGTHRALTQFIEQDRTFEAINLLRSDATSAGIGTHTPLSAATRVHG